MDIASFFKKIVAELINKNLIPILICICLVSSEADYHF